jgi:predicted ATP-grasp superfamily ATP-dependent carboligase
VLKPRDGAGSQATFLIPQAASAAGVFREAAASGLREALLQPFVPGVPASVSFLIGPAGAVPLLPGEQILSSDGRFRYLGGRIPLQPAFARRAVALASRAVAAVPGLRGYVGVDLVLGDAEQEWQMANGKFANSYWEHEQELEIANCKLQIADSYREQEQEQPDADSRSVHSSQYSVLGARPVVLSAQDSELSTRDSVLSTRDSVLSTQYPVLAGSPLGGSGHEVSLSRPSRDVVIEINPRLTTSYVGLRALAFSNLAEHMLAAVRGEALKPIEWREEKVVFAADGRLMKG